MIEGGSEIISLLPFHMICYHKSLFSMKKLFFTLGIVSLILLFVSCTKDNINTNAIEDSYYVQYTVITHSTGAAGSYSLFTVKDIGSGLRQSEFPVTYGPVKKGYTAHIKWTTSTGRYAKATISVSKNGEPFVTKATSSDYSYSGNLSYTIL